MPKPRVSVVSMNGFLGWDCSLTEEGRATGMLSVVKNLDWTADWLRPRRGLYGGTGYFSQPVSAKPLALFEIRDAATSVDSKYAAFPDGLYWWDSGTSAWVELTQAGPITAQADAGDAAHTIITAASHGLSNGATVVITGTTTYNGTYTVSSVATDTFEIDLAWPGGGSTTEAGKWSVAANSLWASATDVSYCEWVHDFGSGGVSCAVICAWTSTGQNCWAVSGSNVDNISAYLPSGSRHPRIAEQHLNRLVLANFNDSGGDIQARSLLRWSDVLDDNTWGTYSYIWVRAADAEELSALQSTQRGLLIFKKHYAGMLRGGAPDQYELQLDEMHLLDSDGCVGPQACCLGTAGAYWFGNQGVYLLETAGRLRKISGSMEKEANGTYGLDVLWNGYAQTDTDLPFVSLSTSHVVAVAATDGRILFTYAANSATANNAVIVWHETAGKWSWYDGWTPSAIGIWPSQSPALVVGDSTGHIWWNSGTLDNATSIEVVLRTGAFFPQLRDQTRYYRFVYGNALLRLTSAQVDMQATIGDRAQDVQESTWSISAGSVYGTGKYGTATYSGSGRVKAEYYFGSGATGRTIDVMLRSTGDVAFYGMQVWLAAIGRDK